MKCYELDLGGAVSIWPDSPNLRPGPFCLINFEVGRRWTRVQEFNNLYK